MTRNFAKIHLSTKLFIDSLEFPVNTDIISIKFNFLDDYIELVVEHKDLPTVEWGDEIPFIDPILTRINFDWNADK